MPESKPPAEGEPPMAVLWIARASETAHKLLGTVREAHGHAEDPYAEMLLFDLIEPVRHVADRLYRMERFAEKRREP